MHSAFLAIALLLGVWQAACAYEVTDDRGRTLSLRQPPQRVVSLLPSLSETVCELGACERLVGVDSWSNWPAQLARLPRLGGVDDADVERILALKPDLVLLDAPARVAARLEKLGLPVLGFQVKTVADVRRAVLRVAQALALPDAPRALERIDAGLAAAARSLPPERRATRVYVEVDSEGYAASAASHVGELLTRLGVENVVPGHLGSVPRLNPEFVVRADPQLMVVPARQAATLAQRPGWGGIQAVRQRRVCALGPADEDVLMRPGPRLAEAAQVLVRCLRGGA